MTRVIDFRVRLPAELRPAAEPPPEHTEQYDAVLNVSATRDRTLTQLRADMAEAGVDRAVVHAEYEFGDPADELNEAVARLVAAEPERFAGCSAATPRCCLPPHPPSVAAIRRPRRSARNC
jgi:uncharacterized protein